MKPMSLLPVPRAGFFVSATLLASLFVAAGPALSAEREHGAHEHGVGQLSLAVEGRRRGPSERRGRPVSLPTQGQLQT